MADPRKVRWSQLKVGVVGLAAFLILAVLIFLLTSTRGFFQKTALLHTFMDDASGMAEGTPVRLNGFTIGSLDGIVLITPSAPKRSVHFIMKVQEKFLRQIPVDDPGHEQVAQQRPHRGGRHLHRRGRVAPRFIHDETGDGSRLQPIQPQISLLDLRSQEPAGDVCALACRPLGQSSLAMQIEAVGLQRTLDRAVDLPVFLLRDHTDLPQVSQLPPQRPDRHPPPVTTLAPGLGEPHDLLRGQLRRSDAF